MPLEEIDEDVLASVEKAYGEEEIDPGIMASIEKAYAPTEKPYIEEDRGFTMDMVSRLARGGLAAVKGVAGAARMADLDPTKDEGILGTAGKYWTEAADKAGKNFSIFKPDIAEVKGEEGIVKRGLGGMAESILPSLAPAVTGLAATVLTGNLVVGGATAAATLFSTFGLGTYQNVYDKAVKDLKEKGDVPLPEIDKLASHKALVDSVAEAGGEFAGDLAALAFFGVIGKQAVKQSLKKTIKELMSMGGAKEFGKALAKAIPFEAGSEMGTAYFQAKSSQDIGLDDVPPIEAVGEAVLPAVFMSILFGSAIRGYQVVKARKVYEQLNSRNPEERVEAARVIAGRLEKDERKVWAETAWNYIQNNKEIPLSKPLVDFATQKSAQDATAKKPLKETVETLQAGGLVPGVSLEQALDDKRNLASDYLEGEANLDDVETGLGIKTPEEMARERIQSIINREFPEQEDAETEETDLLASGPAAGNLPASSSEVARPPERVSDVKDDPKDTASDVSTTEISEEEGLVQPESVKEGSEAPTKPVEAGMAPAKKGKKKKKDNRQIDLFSDEKRTVEEIQEIGRIADEATAKIETENQTIETSAGNPEKEKEAGKLFKAGERVRVGETEEGIVVKVDGNVAKVRMKGMPEKAFTTVKVSRLKKINEAKVAFSKAVEKSFEDVSGQLSTDQKKLVTLLGDQYANKLSEVTIKELVQNSFDAVKESVYKGQIKEGGIDVEVDLPNRTITVTDDGIGMSMETLEKAYFTIGGSKKDVPANLSSGGLGLAKLAFIAGADRIQITTWRDGVETSVDAKTEDIQNNNFKYKRKKVSEKKHGTSVTVHLPTSRIDSATGESRYVSFPYNEKAASEGFLSNPLIGPAKVSMKFGSGLLSKKKKLPLGVAFNNKATPFITKANFSWGTADIYMGTERTESPQHSILSSGLFQFTRDFMVRGWERVPYDIVVDIKPNVRAEHPDYPFTNNREKFKDRVSADVKSLGLYLAQLARGAEASGIKENFKDIRTLPRVEGVGVDYEDGADERYNEAYAEAEMKLEEPVKEEAKKEKAQAPAPKEINILKDLAGIVDSAGKTVLTNENLKQSTFTAEKEAPATTDFMVELPNDPRKPVLHNNLNVDLAELSGDKKRAEMFFAELGTVFTEMKEALAESGKWGYDTLKEFYYSGISLDKGYAGVHIKVPYKGMFLNPFSFVGQQPTSFRGVTRQWMNTMIHELAHTGAMTHGEYHNSEMGGLETYLADNGKLEYFEATLKEVYFRYETEFNKMWREYDQSTTRNAAEGLKKFESSNLADTGREVGNASDRISYSQGAVRIREGQRGRGDLQGDTGRRGTSGELRGSGEEVPESGTRPRQGMVSGGVVPARREAGAGIRQGGMGTASARVDGGYNPRAVGSEITPASRTYSDGAAGEGNVWVRQSGSAENSDRTLMIQFSPELMGSVNAADDATDYYNELYSGKKQGYEREKDFWEIPQWMAYVAKIQPKADVYIVRSMEEARAFLNASGYSRIAFSSMDVNKSLIPNLSEGFKGSVDISGYVDNSAFKGLKNSTFYNTLEEYASALGLKYESGTVDYRHFIGARAIPRLTMSRGCRYKCAFCTVEKEVVATSTAGINQQADAIAVLGSRLVYLNDKTFGQAKNHKYLSEVYARIKKKNPRFEGFIIQTTAADLNKMDDEWLRKSGIRFVELGVESYNDFILKKLHKPANEDLINKATAKLRKNNIALVPNIIIGLPEETRETYAKTLDFIDTNDDIISHLNIYNLAVYENTELGGRIDVKSASDKDENVLEKSFHKNKLIHKAFATGAYSRGKRLVNKGLSPRSTEQIVEELKKPAEMETWEEIEGIARKRDLLRDVTPEKRRDIMAVLEASPTAGELAATAWGGRALRWWYHDDEKFFKRVLGDDAFKFFGVMAATSPQAKAETENIRYGVNAWEDYTKLKKELGRELTEQEIDELVDQMDLGLKARRFGVKRALQGLDLGAVEETMKTRFYHYALFGEELGAVLDIWHGRGMGRVKFSKDKEGIALKQDFGDAMQYAVLSDRMDKAAKILGIPQSASQASQWGMIKAIWDRLEDSRGRRYDALEVLKLVTNKDVALAGNYTTGLANYNRQKNPIIDRLVKLGFPQADIDKLRPGWEILRDRGINPDGKIYESAPAEIQRELEKLATRLGEIKTQMDSLRAQESFSRMGEPMLHVALETTHGPFAELPLAKRMKMHKEIRENVLNDEAIKSLGIQFGVKVSDIIDGPGTWYNPETQQVEKNPNFSVLLSVPPGETKKGMADRIRGFAASLAYANQQAALGFTHPVEIGDLFQSNRGPILMVDLGKAISYGQADALASSLAEEFEDGQVFMNPTSKGVIVSMAKKGGFYPLAYKEFYDKAYGTLDKSIGRYIKGIRVAEKDEFDGGDYYESKGGNYASGTDTGLERKVPSFQDAIEQAGRSGALVRANKLLSAVNEIKDRYATPKIRAQLRAADYSVGRADRTGDGAPQSDSRTGEESISTTGFHWSAQKRTSLSSKFYGTGAPDAASRRVAGDPVLSNRIYFYINTGKGINPEPLVKSGRPFIHKVELSNLYDIETDPLNLLEGKTTVAEREMAVVDAGFNGYISRRYGAAVLLGERTIQAEPVDAVENPNPVPFPKPRIVRNAVTQNADMSDSASDPLYSLSEKDVRDVFKWADSVVKNEDGTFSVFKDGLEMTVEGVERIDIDEARFKVQYKRDLSPELKEQGAAGIRFGTFIQISKIGDVWTLHHESFHMLEATGFISEKDINVINDQLRKEGIAEPNEEDRARWVTKNLKNRATQPSAIKRLLQKIQDLIDSFVNLFQRTSRGVIRDIETGKISRGTARKIAGTAEEYALKQDIDDYVESLRNSFQARPDDYKYPGIIKRAFEYVFGSPELSNHPVMKALSRVFIERNGIFNEQFLRFTEGDHPASRFETLVSAVDSLSPDQMKALEDLDDDMDTSGYTQDEAREYMRRNATDQAVVDVWEDKTARLNTVMDTLIAQVGETVDEIEESATFRGVGPIFPIVGYELSDTGGPDLERPVNLRDYLGILREIKNYAYSPRIRENGSFVVKGKKVASGETYMRFANGRMAAEELKLKIEREGWMNVEIEHSKKMSESVLANLKELDILKLVNDAIDKTDANATNQVYAAELAETLHNIVLSRGYRRHQIRRQQSIVRGYETDFRKKIFTYLTNSAAGMAKAKSAKMAMQIMTGGIKTDTVEGARMAEILGEYLQKPITPTEESNMYEASKKYIADNLRNIEDADRAVATIKKLATFKYLWFTARAPLVNLTAIVTTTAPAIHQHCSNGKGSLTGIFKEIGIAGEDYRKIMLGQRGFLSTSEQQFIDEINRRNYDDPQMVRDMITSMQGVSGRTFDNVVQWGMKPFSYIEQWMRGLTMLAGFRTALKNGMDISAAREAAVEAAGRGHGTYGKATRPYWAQGTDPAARIGQVAATFLKFPQNYLNLLYDLGYTKRNAKAFTWALAAPIVLGGAAAIPFKDNIVWIINAILKALGDDRDVEKMVYDDARLYLGKEAEKNIRTGLMGAVGIDITGSLAMNIGLPTDLLSLTGIFGAMAKETVKAGHYVTTKEYSKALESVLPSGVANIFKSIRELDGATTSTGKRVWSEDGSPYVPTTGETLLRAAGFRSSSRTTTQQRQWESKREAARWKDSRDKIYERYRVYLTRSKKDPAEIQSIYNDIAKYNKAVVMKGRGSYEIFIKKSQLLKISRDMARQPKSERKRSLSLGIKSIGGKEK